MKKIDFVISLILLIFGSLYYYQTFSFISSGAAFVPRIYAILLMTFSLILLIRSFLTKEKFKGGNIKKILITMGITFIYILSIPFLGFHLSSLIFILIILLLRRIKNIFILAGVPIGSVLFIYVFFQKVLNVPVPMGFFS